jgi:hypothetical protein
MPWNSSDARRFFDLMMQINSAAAAAPCAEPGTWIKVPYSKELAAVLPEFMRLQSELLDSLRKDPNRIRELFPDLEDCDIARVCRTIH